MRAVLAHPAEVGSDPRYPDLSLRDADAVAHWDATHEKADA